MSDNLNSENADTKERLSHLGSVITILSVDQELYSPCSEFIDVFQGTINWEKIFELPLSADHRVCVQWAYCIWNNEFLTGVNPLDSILRSDVVYRRAILRALKMHWRA